MVASVARDWLPLKDPAMAQLRTVKTIVEKWKAKEKKSIPSFGSCGALPKGDDDAATANSAAAFAFLSRCAN